MKIFYYYKISRPINIFLGSLSVLITATFFTPFPNVIKLIFAMLVVMLLNAAANCVNDIRDIEIDKINRPNRPLPAGKLNISEVKIFAIILFIVGNIISFSLGIFPFIISLFIATPLMIIYAIKLKQIAIWGNLLVSFILGLAFIFAAGAFGNYKIGIVPAVLAFLFTLIREIIKDMEDMIGDEQFDAKTLPVMIGIDKTKSIVVFLMFVLIIVILIPYLIGVYGVYYLIVVLISVGIPVLLMIGYLLINKEQKKYNYLAKILKVEIFFGLLSIYLGKF
ncbi:MAG: geranylgeranylglycerol-phosphate geranylgeranyltransferase [Candidatus Marinimicrobia bacterium]|nr:geranylgeranylglycerol-phosphate geranylgeranyltransferase [Candidatus Neomarinimicrobiota bacterium]